MLIKNCGLNRGMVNEKYKQCIGNKNKNADYFFVHYDNNKFHG